MKIVIDIPEEEYRCVQITGYIGNATQVSNAIFDGTPLPQGHGALVDYQELKNNVREYGAYAEATLSHIKPKIIIDADRCEE